jgi:hypothetical protein
MPIGVSSAPYAKFAKPGDRRGGEIVDFRIVQTVDFDSKRPQYLEVSDDGDWAKTFNSRREDGKPNDPIVQWEITVDTGVEDENGDSELRIFVDPRKGKRNTLLEGKRGGDAVAIALKKAKAHRVGLEIGGRFFLISGEKVRDGSGPATNTWMALYDPPAGGPGSGKPLDEVPWLVGGGRYDKRAELDKWEKTQMPALRVRVDERLDQMKQAATSSPATPAGPSPTEVAIERGKRAHESSPVLNRSTDAEDDLDDEIPF